jgi:hypothetical protein
MKTTSFYNISFICKANFDNPELIFDIYWNTKLNNHQECITSRKEKKWDCRWKKSKLVQHNNDNYGLKKRCTEIKWPMLPKIHSYGEIFNILLTMFISQYYVFPKTLKWDLCVQDLMGKEGMRWTTINHTPLVFLVPSCFITFHTPLCTSNV